MKRTIQLFTATAAAACLMLPTAQAQETVTRDRVQSQTADAGRLDSKTRGTSIRVSQLIGYNIQNSQGESVGEINDIVIDSRTGKVRYAAVTYGGFLGVGNKLFAVPFEAFKVQVDPDEVGDDDIDADDYVLVLNVTQEQLDGQQGFDEDNWPDMADRKWAADLDKRYGVKRNMDAKDRLNRRNRENNNQ
ncbi:PRC-barrel domain protein [Rubripirellula lacrimiformis]|uniref:PRC-barrel domain protein n=1 Tax=Rubripirellula lacrimiformis TaxID=1930273 RepID=A0A517N523_9BACT|nr:PRC-barrel domain-containing protein [Rubripirellula lacrimiformis]QDT02236.1 PRC-barrel domain protein [Rubripirellula lacrimiformis]